ncbi:F-box domain-containing protein [Aphelenchoides bicaudatus]|nr:F-box domain-containing protein [Aphelenchoides bicaudatus]
MALSPFLNGLFYSLKRNILQEPISGTISALKDEPEQRAANNFLPLAMRNTNIHFQISECSRYRVVEATRHTHKARVDSESQIHIELANGNQPTTKTFHLVNDYNKLEHHLKQIQLTSLTIKGPVDEKIMDSFITLLYKTQQFQIHLFEMQSMSIENKQTCSRLFQLLAFGNCQAITFSNCILACGFSQEQSAQLKDLCQFTVKNCTPSNNGMGILSKYLTKLAVDMRFKPRASLPFYAEAPNLKISEICQFIKTWIAIFEAPHFQITVNNCEAGFKNEFLRECAENGLSHHQLEFKSKSHPMAHIKVVFNDQQHRTQLYPIVDIPPRIERSFCTARQFRDF